MTVLRPRAGTYLSTLPASAGALVVAAGAAAAWLGREGSDSRWGLVAIVLVAAAVSALVATGWIRTSVVTLSPGQVEHRPWLRRTVVRVDAPDATGVLARYDGPTDVLVLAQSMRGPRIRLSGAFWSAEDLETVAAHAGFGRTDGTLTAAEIEQRVPGSTGLHDRHPALLGVGLALVLVAAILAATWPG